MKIRFYDPSDKESWDSYVYAHPDATHCHLSGWKNVIENTYGHKGYYLLAEGNSKIKGILPLFHIKSLLFGNQLVSMPFLNYGGILADSEEVSSELFREATCLCLSLKAAAMELRHMKRFEVITSASNIEIRERAHKVRMLLELPPSKESLLKSFRSKLRSQISRPQKEGVIAKIGGMELQDSFYAVFAINMRDLGSPVHSRRLFQQICQVFPQNIRIGVVYYENIPVAGGLVFCFRDTVEIPWASSLRKYSRLSPNMLLYWAFLELASDKGFKYFDFGRSTPDEGSYRFKEQWGAKPAPLYWYDVVLNGKPFKYADLENSKFDTAIKYWKKLPVPIANIIGPLIRKHISL